VPLASIRSWNARRAALVRLAALAVIPAAGGGPARAGAAGLARELGRARRARVPRRAVVELGLMLRLYAGFPAAIEFLRALAQAWPARTLRRAPASNQPERGYRLRGERLCRRVYGPEYARLRAFMRSLDPDLDRWMILEGYGKTLARPGLGVVDRELATVAALAALGWARQQAAHAQGALRVGATPADVARAAGFGERCRVARGPR
jgi:4-carboxymuconolactone decarboxylase